MLNIYYVHKGTDAQGNHEVHVSSCGHLPKLENRTYLGMFDSCRPAVTAAREHYDNVDGCYFCCNPCHTE